MAVLRFVAMRSCSLVLVCALVACGRSPREPAPIAHDPAPAKSVALVHTSEPKTGERAWTTCGEAAAAPPTSYASLRAVDWCNRDYLPGIAHLRNGRAEIHEYPALGGPHDTDIFLLGSVAVGDLDGDGVEEAAVVLDHQSYGAHGGGHHQSDVFVYALRSGKVVQLDSRYVHYASVARIDARRLMLDYGEPGAKRCTLELQLVAGKLANLSDLCADSE